MRTGTRSTRAKNLFVALFVIVIGVGLIIGATIYKNIAEEKMRTWTAIDAVVVSYDKNLEMDDDMHDFKYHRIVEYEVNGVKYRATEGDSQMFPPTLGVTVTVYYNPQKPSECIFGAGNTLAYILAYGSGGLFAAVGVAIFIGTLKRKY